MVALNAMILATQQRWRNILDRADGRKRALLADTLEPIARTVAVITSQTPKKASETFGAVARQVIDAVFFMAEAHGVRAVIYALEEGADGMYVVDTNSKGKRLAPNNFEAGTRRTRLALELVRTGAPHFEDDIKAHPSDDYAGSGVDYNTFISVPIASATEAFGLLTVDAPHTNDLTEQHVNDFQLMAGILSIAFTGLNGRQAPRRASPFVGPAAI